MSLSLSRAAAVVRPDPLPYQPDEDRDAIQKDIFRPFGVRPDADRLRRASNVGFTVLSEQLLSTFPSDVDSPDLVILAYGIPDPSSLKHVIPHLTHLLGGRSHSFAISEQGLRAPYTALKVADAFARSGRCASLALFVCEQNSLPYPDPLVDENELTNSAALLYFTDRGGYRFAGTWTATATDRLGPLLCSITGRFRPGSAMVVAGPWVDPDDLASTGVPVHRSRPGSYCTSVWLDLARHHRRWPRSHPVLVLCDTDPRTGHSQVALLLGEAGAGTSPEERAS